MQVITVSLLEEPSSLNFEFWISVWILNFEFWILNSGFEFWIRVWTLNFEFWILNSYVLNFEFPSRFWILNFEFEFLARSARGGHFQRETSVSVQFTATLNFTNTFGKCSLVTGYWNTQWTSLSTSVHYNSFEFWILNSTVLNFEFRSQVWILNFEFEFWTLNFEFWIWVWILNLEFWILNCWVVGLF